MEHTGTVGQARFNFCLLVKPVVGLAKIGAVVLVECAMKPVGTALGHDTDLSAGGSALIGVGVGGRNAELLNRVQRNPQCPLKRKTLQLVVVVQAIHSHIGLVAAGTRNRSATAVFCPIRLAVILIGVASKIGDARLQTENRDRIPALGRKIDKLRAIEHVALCSVGRVHQRRLTSHFDDLSCALHLHRDVQGRRLAHLQGNLILLQCGESCYRYRQRIGRRRNFKELIHAIVGRFCRSRESGRRVIERDRSALQNRASGIGDGAAQRCGCSLSRNQSVSKEESNQQSNYT